MQQARHTGQIYIEWLSREYTTSAIRREWMDRWTDTRGISCPVCLVSCILYLLSETSLIRLPFLLKIPLNRCKHDETMASWQWSTPFVKKDTLAHMQLNFRGQLVSRLFSYLIICLSVVCAYICLSMCPSAHFKLLCYCVPKFERPMTWWDRRM